MSSNFTNQVITAAELADIQPLVAQPLAKRYAIIHRCVFFGATLLWITGGVIVLKQSWLSLPQDLQPLLNLLIWFGSVSGVLLTCYVWLADGKKSYTLREHDLSYRSGLIFQKTITQPVSRIQHIELKQGPIERRAGLASLQVFSAGGALHTFVIPGLPLAEAQNIRQFILQHKKAQQHG